MGEGASDGQRTTWQELVLSFHHGDSGSQTRVIRLCNLPAESSLNPSVLRAFHVLITTLQGATSSA